MIALKVLVFLYKGTHSRGCGLIVNSTVVWAVFAVSGASLKKCGRLVVFSVALWVVVRNFNRCLCSVFGWVSREGSNCEGQTSEQTQLRAGILLG